MAGVAHQVMARVPVIPPPRAYDESMVRRFEPGTAESLTRNILREAGYQFRLGRGLVSVGVVDAKGKSKKFTWREFEAFVDGLRIAAGREPIFTDHRPTARPRKPKSYLKKLASFIASEGKD